MIRRHERVLLVGLGAPLLGGVGLPDIDFLETQLGQLLFDECLMPDELVVLDGFQTRRDGLEGEKLAQKIDDLLVVRVDQFQNFLFSCVDHRMFPFMRQRW